MCGDAVFAWEEKREVAAGGAATAMCIESVYGIER